MLTKVWAKRFSLTLLLSTNYYILSLRQLGKKYQNVKYKLISFTSKTFPKEISVNCCVWRIFLASLFLVAKH